VNKVSKISIYDEIFNGRKDEPLAKDKNIIAL
jgi:hypothetical protein